MTRLCDACGKPIKGGVQMGSALVCRTCDPELQERMAEVRASGKPVNAIHIARKMFKEGQNPAAYPLRDVPEELWTWVQVQAKKEGSNARDLILRALYEYQERHPD